MCKGGGKGWGCKYKVFQILSPYARHVSYWAVNLKPEQEAVGELS